MMLPLQTAGMSSFSVASSIYEHLPRHNIAILAHQGSCTTNNAQLPSTRIPGPSIGLQIPGSVLDLELGFNHVKLEKHKGLPDLATSPGNLPAVDPFVDLHHFMPPFKHLCATEGRPKSIEAHPQVSSPSLSSDTARQTQVHEFNNAIHRLMPHDRVIHFNVDKSSFISNGIPDAVADVVIASAKEVASRIQRQNLGISFAYKPISDSSTVFDIRYDPSLAPRVGAQSFFPSDPRTEWKLSISQSVVTSQCNLYYLPNILAHEFAHILGLRHWHAHTHEVTQRSFHWPNTSWNCRESVMVTGVPPWEIMFSEEDFRVIREIYSLSNGYVLAGREIIDIHP